MQWPSRSWAFASIVGRKLAAALRARLDGKRADLPWEFFDLRERPPFFIRVWKAMYAIPFGEVRTYGQIAAAAGSPSAVRAAGQACGANPIVLFIPCHRVVAANGPGGFGSGLEWKAKLLALEGVALKGKV
jgi:O-6-methylguanine DNA methyltransferase